MRGQLASVASGYPGCARATLGSAVYPLRGNQRRAVRGERSGDPGCARATLDSAVYPLRGKCSPRLLADGGEQYNHRRHVLTRRLLDSRQKAHIRDQRRARSLRLA